MIEPTYVMFCDLRARIEAIRCLVCGLTSYHPEDVRNMFCANCHRFHEPRRADD